MIESPVLQEWFAERDTTTYRGLILKKLQARFGAPPADVSAAVRAVGEPQRLELRLDAVYASATRDGFRAALNPPSPPAT